MNEVVHGGEQAAAISNAVVQILRRVLRARPTKAKTYLFENYVFCVLEDILTTVERTLVNNGKENLVREVRLTFQEEVADRFTSAVEEIVGRRVVTYHSQVVFHPPMAFEIFVLEE